MRENERGDDITVSDIGIFRDFVCEREGAEVNVG